MTPKINPMKFVTAVFVFLAISVQTISAEKYEYVVALDGTGDFTSIQQAIEACKIFPDQRITIHLKKGIYHEKVVVPSGNTLLSIIGENAEQTIITNGDFFNKMNRGRNSTFYTYTLKVEASDFILENVTVENSAGPVGQAVALHVEGDRCVFRNCRFLGNQDTVYAAGERSRQFFSNCYIEGTTDFVFGDATAWFGECLIHCKANSFITAASTTEGKPFGFVFQNCKISAASGVDKVFLGRPWRSWAKVAFLSCEMGSFIRPEGWDNWSKPENEKTAQFSEYNNFSPGSDTGQRVNWSVKLRKKEALKYTKKNVFAPVDFETEGKKKWYE